MAIAKIDGDGERVQREEVNGIHLAVAMEASLEDASLISFSEMGDEFGGSKLDVDVS